MISRINRLPALIAAGILAASLMSSADAQTDSAPAATPAATTAPAPASAPAATPPARAEGAPASKMIGDWNVRCFPVQSEAPCDIFQMLVNKKMRVRVMSMSIAYAPAQSRYLIQITVPLEVALAKGVTIEAGSYTSPKMIYRRCAADGCVVEGPVDASIITALSQAGDTAKMVVVSRDGKTIRLPMSLKGYSEALESMKSQAQQKTQK